MRMTREFYKPQNDGVYLHVYNHTVSMEFGQLPLGEQEKEIFRNTIERYLHKYNIDLISLVFMGNHYHMLIYCHPKRLSTKQAIDAFKHFHKTEKSLDESDWRILELMKHSNNFSEFMREVQRSFSIWYNKTRPYKRKGALWQDRFQCQLIQSDVYLWSCLQYIELNPVRAGICHDPADYEHSTFGRWSKEKSHPYKQNFMKHILNLAGNKIKLEEFREYMHSKMKIATLHDRWDNATEENVKETLAQAILHETEQIQEIDLQVVTFSKKEWKTQKIIGSEAFIRDKYRRWEMIQHSA